MACLQSGPYLADAHRLTSFWQLRWLENFRKDQSMLLSLTGVPIDSVLRGGSVTAVGDTFV
jgi:hypothetical protein